MVGNLEIGKAQKDFNENSISSEYIRLERMDDDYVDVYEVHHVLGNDNIYVRHHEEPFDNDGKRYSGAIYPNKYLPKTQAVGHQLYVTCCELEDRGYEITGTYTSDICRYSKRIK